MMLNINHCSNNINSSTNNCVISMTNHGTQSKDEVDFVLRPPATAAQDRKKDEGEQKKSEVQNGVKKAVQPNKTSHSASTDMKGNLKASLSTLEKLSIFGFSKKINSKSTASAPVTNPSDAVNDAKMQMSLHGSMPQEGHVVGSHKMVKGASIARLLGNTYNTKKFEKELAAGGDMKTKFNTFSGGRRRGNGPYLEKFKKCCKEDEDLCDVKTPPATAESISDSKDVAALNLENFHDSNKDLSAKAFRTISRGLGKLWWKRTHSVDISTPDPEFKVSYLGNVLTGWAKGEGCVEKQLNTLWRNYTQNNKPDVIMRIKVCASGLKATTRQHGLTEYWANRITHCCAPKNFPRVFCWIYRHEGRKLKHELRCHAILCSKEKVVQEICDTLKENLERALREFKREKILKQNARLSLANAAYDNPSLPRRKILLSVGGNNYRPPLERSKSAPKLMAIEEAIGEEEGEEAEETNEPEMRACCQKDSLYPAMTLGRRRCRRGHSIRRTGKARPTFCETFNTSGSGCCNTKDSSNEEKKTQPEKARCKDAGEGGSDEDDFDKLLMFNNYDTDSPLAGELLPYFDLQMHKKANSSSLNDLTAHCDHEADDEDVIEEHPNFEPSAGHTETQKPCEISIGDLCSDDDEELLDDEIFFRQASILNMLHRNSMRKMTSLSMSSGESSLENQGSTGAGNQVISNRKQLSMDSDEGSISSGCETASTVTANVDDMSLKYRHIQQQVTQTSFSTQSPGESHEAHAAAEEMSSSVHEENCQRNEPEATDTLYSSRTTISLKIPSPGTQFKRNHCCKQSHVDHDGSDSECSDESGYVEYQDTKASNSTQRASTSTAV